MTREDALCIARANINTPKLEIRFWSKVNLSGPNDCWEWKAATRNKSEGYGAFWFEGRHHPAHRIAYYIQNGVLATDEVVCHDCDNPKCCNPSHLFLGTLQDNEADKDLKGRRPRGDSHVKSKLTSRQVMEIRKIKNKRRSEIAKEYGVKKCVIDDLLSGRTWRHL